MRTVNICRAKEWKIKRCSACTAAKTRECSLAAISAILRARLLRSHIIMKTTKTPSGQTSNAILKLTQCALFHWCLLLPCERKPTETGSNPVLLSRVRPSYLSMWKWYKWLWVYNVCVHVEMQCPWVCGCVGVHACVYIYVFLCSSLCQWCGSVDWESNCCQTYLPRPASSPVYFLMM